MSISDPMAIMNAVADGGKVMVAQSAETTIERSKPNLREEYDGVKFRTLMPGITTHPLIRSGRPCIEGTGLMVTDIAAQQKYHGMNPGEIADHFAIELYMVEDALNYYAAHTDYIDTDMQLDILNDEQLVESHYGDFTREILSRRESIARDSETATVAEH